MTVQHHRPAWRATAASALLILVACSSQPLQGAAGQATASAVLVAVPLIPFVKVYDVLNDTEGKRLARFERWNSTFGPIYAERAALIRARDVSADVKAALAAGPVGYLPHIPDSGLYSGIAHRPDDWRENNQRILQNPLLVYLQTLLDDDPKDSHPDEQGYRYNRAAVAYADFDQLRDEYRRAFNTTLEAALQ